MPEGNSSRCIKEASSEQCYLEEEQAQFLVRLERAYIDNPDLPRSFVRNALLSMVEHRSLSGPFIPRNSQKEL